MKLVFIYGPPAVGKFSVAKELSKITNYNLFHNHLINDMLDEIIDNKKDSSQYWKEANFLKVRLIEKAASSNKKGLIFTSLSIKEKKSGTFPERIKKSVEKHNGKVYFVHLDATDKKLFKRVKEKSRKKYNKFSSVKALKKFLRGFEVHKSLSFKNQLEIDNTNLSPKKTALIIKNHFKL